MLNYGREALRRNSTLICYNFYKNMLLTLPLFYYGFASGMSAPTFYEATYTL